MDFSASPEFGLRSNKRRNVADLDPAERRELAELIRGDGIVRTGEGRTVVDRRGVSRPWALYTPNVTLTSRGMSLAGRALLAKLATFSSTQIAGSGFTSMPLLGACVLLGGGRYTGLVIRDKPKAYVMRQRIDGPYDRSLPVVLVDDSISSGTALHRAIDVLEHEGFEVEGAVVLVRFPFRGGAEWAYGSGYRVESVFDIWQDLGMARSEPPKVVRSHAASTSCRTIASGLPPAVAARRIAEAYLCDGVSPRAPDRLDQDYDSRGGVWVSFRNRRDEYRVAREGFWHFDPEPAHSGRDLVAATVRTIQRAGEAVSLERLRELKLAVTFFGPLERIAPAQLDFDCYGIVVRDRVSGRKLGGALPNTQVFVSEMGQYHHAWIRNARLAKSEPHDLFRHKLVKCLEPGETWLPYGIPDGNEVAWAHSSAVGRALVDRVRSLAGAHGAQGISAAPLGSGLVPYPVWGVAVGFYDRGRTALGVAVASDPAESPLDGLLCRATAKAVSQADDPGCGYTDPVGVGAVVVTLLHDPERHGAAGELAAGKLRRGRDAVVASARGGHVVALPSAIPYSNINRRELVDSLAAAVAQQGGHAAWTTYRTTAWLGGTGDVCPLEFGFPRRAATPRYREIIELLAGHILASRGADGIPAYHLDPVRGTVTSDGATARRLSALVALDAAGRTLRREDWIAAARAGLLHCLDHVGHGAIAGAVQLPGQRNGILADCVLLAGVCGAGSSLSDHAAVPSLVARVAGMLRADGRICHKPVRLAHRQDHDFLPGAALLAAAAAAEAGLTTLDPRTLEACLRWQRERFRLLQSWGMAGWQPQAWAAVWRLIGDSAQAAFVFELADWAIERQLIKTGAFLEDLAYTEPTFNTGFIAEAIAAAWQLARETGAAEREERYRGSWERAMRFLDTLVVHPEDTFCMADPDRAVGGVRTSITRSGLRIDAVSHVLGALVAGERLYTRSLSAHMTTSSTRVESSTVR